MTNETVKSWLPTRKWIGLLITEVAGIAASWILTGDFDSIERAMAASALASLAATYVIPNENTPAGVPRKRRKR